MNRKYMFITIVEEITEELITTIEEKPSSSTGLRNNGFDFQSRN